MKFICFGFGGEHRRCLFEKYFLQVLCEARNGGAPFNSSTQEAKADYSVSSRLAWSTQPVLGQLALRSETLSEKQTKKCWAF